MTKMISGGPNVSHQLCMPGWHEGEKEGEKRKKGKDWGVCPRAAEDSTRRPSLLLTQFRKAPRMFRKELATGAVGPYR